MMARIVGFIGAGLLAGCADLNSLNYVLGSGDANYDVLKTATDACQAKGGVVAPRKHYDPRSLTGYECVFGKAG